MSVEVAIWRIDESTTPISLGGMGYEQELQEIIAADLSIVAPGLMIIGREVATPGGRVDVLAIDADGNLIVIELKRGRTPREVVAQTLDYGSSICHMGSEEIDSAFADYQRRFSSVTTPKTTKDALQERFNDAPEELNTSHRLIIVAEEPDPSTERIVTYLREKHGVDINVVLFRAFKDEERRYLTRAWLKDPTDVPLPPALPWNGEFYVSFGEGDHRRWNDAKRYGFVSAGGGDWYVRTLRMLEPGNRIWVSVPRTGYVGIGRVTKSAVRYDEFEVNLNGASVPITEVGIEAPSAFDEEHGEYFVRVDWIKAVDLREAVKERGFFGNQNTVAQPRSPKWQLTVNRLKAIWGVDQSPQASGG